MGCRRGWFLDRACDSSPRNCVPYCVTGLRPRASSVWLRQTTSLEEMPGRDARLSRESHVSGASLEGIAAEAKERLKGRPASRSYATERMTRVVRVSLRCKSGFIPCLFPLLHGAGHGPESWNVFYDLGQGAAAATGKTQAAD